MRVDAHLELTSQPLATSCRLMESYRKDAEERGTVVALNCQVTGGKVSGAVANVPSTRHDKPHCTMQFASDPVLADIAPGTRDANEPWHQRLFLNMT